MGRPHSSNQFVVIALAMTAVFAFARFVSAQVPLEVLHEFGGPAGRYPGDP